MEHLPFLELRNISKVFGTNVVLQDIHLQVNLGELHCIIGQNGCGKSTLMKIISGVYTPEAGGTIILNGTTYHFLSSHEAKIEGIEVIFQDLSLFPNLTMAENISFEHNLTSQFSFVSKKKYYRDAQKILDMLHIDIALDTIVDILPIAQRQVVAICRALRANAKLIIMDEPTTSLTRQEVNALFKVVNRLRDGGVTFIFVSHRLDEIHEMADVVTIMRDGKKIGSYDASEITITQMETLMAGVSIDHSKKRHIIKKDEILDVRALYKKGQYHDVTFSVSKGEVLGIIGLLGAGRTELALTLFGMNKPDKGTVMFEGHVLSCRSNKESIQRGIAYVSEDRLNLGLVMPQSIGDNIMLPTIKYLAGMISNIDIPRRNHEIDHWITRLGIKVDRATDPVEFLSGGNQQRVVLAKWLATTPKLLILDSPTVGVDIAAKATIYEFIKDIAEKGIAVIIISDEIPEIYATADRVMHMRHGTIQTIFSPANVSAESFFGALVQ